MVKDFGKHYLEVTIGSKTQSSIKIADLLKFYIQNRKFKIK